MDGVADDIPKTANDTLSELGNELSRRVGIATGTFGDWVMPTYSRVEATTKPQDVADFFLDADSKRVGFRLPTSLAQDYLRGKKIKLHVDRGGCIKGVGGDTKIVKSEVVAGKLEVTTAKKVCCNGGDLDEVTGRVRLLIPTFTPIRDFERGEVRKRDTGGLTSLTAGRQSGRCCR